jgi:hypothetical protein
MALVSMTALTGTRGHLQGANGHEARQRPPPRDEASLEAPPVRFMDAVVEALALGARGLRHAVAAAPGRPNASVRLLAGESKTESVVGLDNHLYLIWNVSCIPGWELV